jgi:hypothetical protein
MTTAPPPRVEPHSGAFSCAEDDLYQVGLTKREYFAAVAMQGLLSQHVATRAEYVKPSDFKSQPLNKAPFKNSMHLDEVKELARGAVILADALIAELDKNSI